jgi:hypothetical protein
MMYTFPELELFFDVEPNDCFVTFEADLIGISAGLSYVTAVTSSWLS